MTLQIPPCSNQKTLASISKKRLMNWSVELDSSAWAIGLGTGRNSVKAKYPIKPNGRTINGRLGEGIFIVCGQAWK